tara:strand:+ start:1089 stop:2138 length:1050 start_codon:yes stop_codon:yes gene_type:complete
MTKNILVTGSNGFLGEEVVNYFSKKNNVYALDKIKPIDFKESTNNIFKVVCDICDYDKLNNVFENNKFDIIIHCAAEILDEKNTNLVWKTNVDGTKNILDLCEKFSVKKFIFTSTFSIFEKNYDNPVDEKEPPSAVVDYGKSKYAAENIILRHTFQGDVTIFRCPVIIGKKRLDKLALLFEMIRQNLNVYLIGDGSNRIHFIYSLDLIEAINLSLELSGKNLFNVGSDNVNSIHQVFEKLLKHAKSRKKIIKFPKYIGLFILKLLSLFNLVSLGPYHQRMLVYNCVLNTNKVKDKLNWKPKYSNEEMLIECYEYYKSSFNQNKDNSSSKKLPNLKIINFMKKIDLFKIL